MRFATSILLLVCSLAIFALEYQVRGAGDLVKIDRLANLKWPLYALTGLVAISLLVSLVRITTKPVNRRASQLCLAVDVLSVVVLAGCFWLIARM